MCVYEYMILFKSLNVQKVKLSGDVQIILASVSSLRGNDVFCAASKLREWQNLKCLVQCLSPLKQGSMQGVPTWVEKKKTPSHDKK